MEEIIGCSIPVHKPVFEKKSEVVSDKKANEKYIVVFPGASDKKKKWSAENFGILCRKISESEKVNFIICGSGSDKSSAEKIIGISGIKNIEDRTRDGSLKELIELISEAGLLITNDTCALHIGAALNIKTICISSGLHYGRFHPYPKELSDKVITLYPDKELICCSDIETAVKKFHLSSDLDINKISCDEVYNNANIFLKQLKRKNALI